MYGQYELDNINGGLVRLGSVVATDKSPTYGYAEQTQDRIAKRLWITTPTTKNPPAMPMKIDTDGFNSVLQHCELGGAEKLSCVSNNVIMVTNTQSQA